MKQATGPVMITYICAECRTVNAVELVDLHFDSEGIWVECPTCKTRCRIDPSEDDREGPSDER